MLKEDAQREAEAIGWGGQLVVQDSLDVGQRRVGVEGMS